MKEIFEYIKADKFFKSRLPFLRNYKYKILGYNSRKNQVDFSEAEKKQIKAELKALFKYLDSCIK